MATILANSRRGAAAGAASCRTTTRARRRGGVGAGVEGGGRWIEIVVVEVTISFAPRDMKTCATAQNSSVKRTACTASDASADHNSARRRRSNLPEIKRSFESLL
jgi:hypothetical protein